MNKKQMLLFTIKGLSYVCIGLMIYDLFCLKGTWAVSLATSMVTKITPLLIIYYIFDVMARKIGSDV